MTEKMRKGEGVFHFKLSTPHFLDIETTFDFDTRTALKEIDMFFSVT